jgi:hypothetical protein
MLELIMSSIEKDQTSSLKRSSSSLSSQSTSTEQRDAEGKTSHDQREDSRQGLLDMILERAEQDETLLSNMRSVLDSPEVKHLMSSTQILHDDSDRTAQDVAEEFCLALHKFSSMLLTQQNNPRFDSSFLSYFPQDLSDGEYDDLVHGDMVGLDDDFSVDSIDYNKCEISKRKRRNCSDRGHKSI